MVHAWGSTRDEIGIAVLPCFIGLARPFTCWKGALYGKYVHCALLVVLERVKMMVTVTNALEMIQGLLSQLVTKVCLARELLAK